MLKKRQRIAEYLIEHASSLPYDCATELDVQVIPSSAPQNNDEQVPSSELHFVQATWDPSEYAFTLQELHVSRLLSTHATFILLRQEVVIASDFCELFQ